MSKLRTSVVAFVKSESMHAKLDHLTAMEINSVRPLLPHALDQMLRLRDVRVFRSNVTVNRKLAISVRQVNVNLASLDGNGGSVSASGNLAMKVTFLYRYLRLDDCDL